MRKLLNGIILVSALKIPSWLAFLLLWGFIVVSAVGVLRFVNWVLIQFYPYFGPGGVFVLILATLAAGVIYAMRKS